MHLTGGYSRFGFPFSMLFSHVTVCALGRFQPALYRCPRSHASCEEHLAKARVSTGAKYSASLAVQDTSFPPRSVLVLPLSVFACQSGPFRLSNAVQLCHCYALGRSHFPSCWCWSPVQPRPATFLFLLVLCRCPCSHASCKEKLAKARVSIGAKYSVSSVDSGFAFLHPILTWCVYFSSHLFYQFYFPCR